MGRRWCSSCTKVQPVEKTDLGSICCTRCGKVIDEDIYSNEPTFVKNAAGQSQLSGNFVRTIQSSGSGSTERTLEKAHGLILSMADYLGIAGGDQIALPAKRFYAMALAKNFTRGRSAEQVAAACLYVACRANNKPFLLIEFSEYLRVNVYVLGAVFLQLCKLLRLEEHPIVQKPVDPSLFIHRFTHGLLKETNHEVEKTALRIIASMKRDWMQTGRKPSGLCGAALYISALSHGFKFSKSEIVKIVHICEATLTKRLIEFEGTASGSLTIEEFNQKALELERNGNTVEHANAGCSKSKVAELLCEHRGSGAPHFAHGLCATCYEEFISLSGGLDGGSEPPAFQRAERERLAKTASNEDAANLLLEAAQGENSSKDPNNEKVTRRPDASGSDHFGTMGSVDNLSGVPSEHEAVDDLIDKSEKADYMGTEGDESESFSDIDDAEVDGYLHNEEEKHYKKIIWEEMNREYIEEQKAKEAAAAAAREAHMAKYQNCSAEMIAQQELVAAAAAAAAKNKKERQQKRAAEAKNAKTAAEATYQMLTKKRISSNVNYDKLKELLDEPGLSDNPKKSKTEAHPEKNEQPRTTKSNARAQDENHEAELETLNEHEEGDLYGDYQDNSYYDNEEEYEYFDDEFF